MGSVFGGGGAPLLSEEEKSSIFNVAQIWGDEGAVLHGLDHIVALFMRAAQSAGSVAFIWQITLD